MKHQNVANRRTSRFLWGGVGATIPILATLLYADGAIIAEYLRKDHLELVGYGVRVFALFIVGGVWAYLHKSEYDARKLLQLGLVAPSLILTMINSNNVQNLRDVNLDNPKPVFSFNIIPSAYAQDGENNSGSEHGETQDDSGVVKKIVKGFLGQ